MLEHVNRYSANTDVHRFDLAQADQTGVEHPGDCVELACSHRRPSAVLNAWWRAKRWGERMATG
jgi:hypothetical protein